MALPTYKDGVLTYSPGSGLTFSYNTNNKNINVKIGDSTVTATTSSGITEANLSLPGVPVTVNITAATTVISYTIKGEKLTATINNDTQRLDSLQASGSSSVLGAKYSYQAKIEGFATSKNPIDGQLGVNSGIAFKFSEKSTIKVLGMV